MKFSEAKVKHDISYLVKKKKHWRTLRRGSHWLILGRKVFANKTSKMVIESPETQLG